MRRNWQRDPERGLWLPDRRIMPYAPRAPKWGGGLGPRRAVAPSAGLSVLQSTAWNDSGPGTSKSFTPSSALTAGSALVFLGASETSFDGVSDGTNTWTRQVNIGPTGSQYLQAWVAPNNAASGTPAITLTAAGAYTLFGGIFFEVGGASTSAPYETSGNTTNGYGTDRYCGSLTVAGSALVIGWLIDSNTGLDNATYGLTPDATWTRVDYITSCVNLGAIYKIVTAGTYNPHGTVATAYGGNIGASIAIK